MPHIRGFIVNYLKFTSDAYVRNQGQSSKGAHIYHGFGGQSLYEFKILPLIPIVGYHFLPDHFFPFAVVKNCERVIELLLILSPSKQDIFNALYCTTSIPIAQKLIDNGASLKHPHFGLTGHILYLNSNVAETLLIEKLKIIAFLLEKGAKVYPSYEKESIRLLKELIGQNSEINQLIEEICLKM